MDANKWKVVGAIVLVVGSGVWIWVWLAGGLANPTDTGWVYDFQTIIGAFVALGGAAATVFILNKQIRQQRDQFRKQLNVATARLRLEVSEAAAKLAADVESATAKLAPASEFQPPPTWQGVMRALRHFHEISRGQDYRTVRQYLGSSAIPLVAKLLRSAADLSNTYSGSDDDRWMVESTEFANDYEVDALFHAGLAALAELEMVQLQMQIGLTPEGDTYHSPAPPPAG